MYVTTINEIDIMNLKKSKEDYMGGFGERKWKGEKL